MTPNEQIAELMRLVEDHAIEESRVMIALKAGHSAATEKKHREEARAAIEVHARKMVEGEPVAYMWQHEGTGCTGFIDPWQVEQGGWRDANPRLQIVGKLFSTPQPAPQADQRAVMQMALKCLEIGSEKKRDEAIVILRAALATKEQA